MKNRSACAAISPYHPRRYQEMAAEGENENENSCPPQQNALWQRQRLSQRRILQEGLSSTLIGLMRRKSKKAERDAHGPAQNEWSVWVSREVSLTGVLQEQVDF